MGVHSYEELRQHAGHRVEVVTYPGRNAAVECEDCGVVLMDFEKGDS